MPKGRFRVLFQKSAFKEYKALPRKMRDRVDQVLEVLSINPLSEILRFRKIRGKENHYRVRIGDYRLIYSPQAEALVVRVIKVAHRREVYRHF